MINRTELVAVGADEGDMGAEVEVGVELTPESIANARFVTSVRGYNREDVDAFLRGIADDYHRVLAELQELRAAYDARVGEQQQPEESASAEEAALAEESASVEELVPAEEPAPAVEPAPSPFKGSAALESPASPEVETGREAIGDASVVAQVTAILFDADEAAWRIRDEAEREFDRSRVEAIEMVRMAEERAAEVREGARRRSRSLLEGPGEIPELAASVNRQLIEADATATEITARAREASREHRRTLYERLVASEMEARAVLERAHRDVCTLMRGAHLPARSPDDASPSPRVDPQEQGEETS